MPGDAAADFARALADLREARMRPEVRITEVPAPQRIAPYAVALTAEVVGAGGDEELSSGRFVLLHDPSCPEPWEGAWRAVTFARAELEPVVSERFGGLADRVTTVELEVRASWTPLDARLGEHLLAWSDLLCQVAGLPPLPDGVVALPGPRR